MIMQLYIILYQLEINACMVRELQERSSAIYPVARRKRVLSGADLFLLWAGSAIAVDVWYSGGAMGGIGWLNGLAMIVLGSFAGSAILAAAGMIGSDHGIPSMVSSRLAYGIRGSYLLSAINYFALVGWTAWMININASAADKIGQILFGFEGFHVWIFVCGAACTAMALLGAEGWRRFSRVAVIALIVTTVAINALLISSSGLEALGAAPSQGMPLGIGFDLALIIPLSWAPLASDYSRFAKSTKGAFFGSLFGQGITNAWFFATGFACVLILGTLDPTVYVTQIGGPLFGVAALFVIWIGTLTTTFLDIYSANISAINVFPKLKEWQGSIITGVLGTALALMPWLSAFVEFLYIIGAIFAPSFAIVIADYFVVRRRRLVMGEIYEKSARGRLSGFSVAAIASWLFGMLFYFLAKGALEPVGVMLPTFLATAAFYIAVKWLSRLARHGTAKRRMLQKA